MDRHDQELLAKQLRGVSPPRHDGIAVLTVIMVFLVGTAFGAALTPSKNARMRTAWNAAAAAISPAIGRLPDMR